MQSSHVYWLSCAVKLVALASLSELCHTHVSLPIGIFMNSPIGYSDIDPGVFWKLATREIGTGFVESTVSVMGRSLSAQDM